MVQNKNEQVCDRCGCDVSQRLKSRLYPHKFTDCIGEEVEMKLCWDCDWDVSNGGDPFADFTEIIMDRQENDYEYDPVNTPKPSWLK